MSEKCQKATCRNKRFPRTGHHGFDPTKLTAAFHDQATSPCAYGVAILGARKQFNEGDVVSRERFLGPK
jgi:hypothetical protein